MPKKSEHEEIGQPVLFYRIMAESDDEVYFDSADYEIDFDSADAALSFAKLRWVLGELDEAMDRVEALSVSPPPSPPSSPVPSPPPFPPSAAECDAAMAVISRHIRNRRSVSPPAKYDPWTDVGLWILAPSAVAAAGLIFDATFPACKSDDDDFPFSLFY